MLLSWLCSFCAVLQGIQLKRLATIMMVSAAGETPRHADQMGDSRRSADPVGPFLVQ